MRSWLCAAATLSLGCFSLRSPLDQSAPRDAAPAADLAIVDTVNIDSLLVDVTADGARADALGSDARLSDAAADRGPDEGDGALRDAVADGPEVSSCGGGDQPCCDGDGLALCAAGLTCRAGRCAPCALRCDGQCVSPDSLLHCGGCGNACAISGATAACSNGRCVIARCDPGFADCDNDPSTGCEVNLLADTDHCGRCGTQCIANNVADRSCRDGVCAIAGCLRGFGDCNGSLADGCEADLRDNPDRCGACGRVCPTRANSARACTSGDCVLRCNTGFADCDNDPTNGCEVDTRSSAAHCAMCNNACPAGQVCSASACGCPSGQTLCSGQCVTLSSSTSHCGQCGRSCATPANGAARCTSGACGITCNTGYNASGSTCVACGALDRPACSAGTACATGLTSCSGTCRDRNADDAHCGACGSVCGTTQRCVSGSCTACGAVGQPCCRSAPCGTGLTCMGGLCQM